jgi:homoserine dehydrogenase
MVYFRELKGSGIMAQIAILGFGVVGSGIWECLDRNRTHIERKAGQAITVKRVLDIRSFPGQPVEAVLTHDFEDIINDKDIQIIAEVMGGLEPAYTYVKQALLAGKHVCTSNKELVSVHGAELLAIAREKALNFMFEASVGGGIPIVRPLNVALTTDEIAGVAGIINGTTNYILTQMSVYNKDFGDMLEEAQQLGYAEKDPTADVQGYDTCRKLAILLSLATGKQVDYRQIHTEGITGITRLDFTFARHFGYTVKLLADGRVKDNGVEALTVPMLVHHSHPFYTVSDVFNCVLVQAKMTNDVLFTGRGAGKLPTAGAVISDIVDVANHLHRHIQHSWSSEGMPVLPLASYRKRKMVSVKYTDRKKALETIGERNIFDCPNNNGCIAWLTDYETEEATRETVDKLSKSGHFTGTPKVLRIYEPIEIE